MSYKMLLDIRCSELGIRVVVLLVLLSNIAYLTTQPFFEYSTVRLC